MVIKPAYDAGSIFVNGLAPVKKGNKCGYIDKQGKMVIDPDYEWDQRSIDMFLSYYTTMSGETKK
jgi:hypothetical protein